MSPVIVRADPCGTHLVHQRRGFRGCVRGGPSRSLLDCVMSLHKITAGSGYDYLTRQVAVQDSTEKGHAGLASYYTQRGESPGVWMCSGMAGLEGLNVGDVMTAEQMQSLFGAGMHPLALKRIADLQGRGLTERDY